MVLERTLEVPAVRKNLFIRLGHHDVQAFGEQALCTTALKKDTAEYQSLTVGQEMVRKKMVLDPAAQPLQL